MASSSNFTRSRASKPSNNMNDNEIIDGIQQRGFRQTRHYVDLTSSQPSLHVRDPPPIPNSRIDHAMDDVEASRWKHPPTSETNHMSESSKAELRRERKRMWRKTLTGEKLDRLRERDALRKRTVRENMSQQERDAMKSKEAARKAELRREKRMKEKTAQGGGSSQGDVRLVQHPAPRTDDGVEGKNSGEPGKYRKISVDSLLNWIKWCRFQIWVSVYFVCVALCCSVCFCVRV